MVRHISSHSTNIAEHDSRYEGLSSRRVDLVGDYAGNELFLLDGDSLLLNSLNDPLLDFDGKHCCNVSIEPND